MLPNDYVPEATYSLEVNEAITAVVPFGSTVSTIDVATRLAQFGIDSTSLLAALSRSDVERIFYQYKNEPTQTILNTIPAKLIVSNAIGRLQQTLNQQWRGPSATPGPSPPAPFDMNAGLIALSKALKRKKVGDPHRPPVESEDEETFDITSVMKSKNFPRWGRSETLEPSTMARMREAMARHVEKGRPYVSFATGSLLKHFSPRPSAIWDQDPVRASERIDARSRAFESPIQLIRHLKTWAHVHIAIDAMSLHNYLLFELHILEILDAHGTAVGQQYLMTRLNQMKDEVDLTMSLPSEAPRTGSNTLNRLLLEENPAILQNILINFGKRKSDHHYDKDTPVKDRDPKGKGKGKEGNIPKHVCFDEDARAKTICSRKGKGCDKTHLDTSNSEDAIRWDKAKVASTRFRG